MRTSSYQFEVMVKFMEEHGDLGKTQYNARGRISHANKWEDLTALLNCDVKGDAKTSSQWKKVWADLKNNTKKKHARIQRAAKEGSPIVYAKLTGLVHRVLDLLGLHVETTMTIEETGSSSGEEETTQKKTLHRVPPRVEPDAKRPKPDHAYIEAPYDTIFDNEWRKFKVQQHRDFIALKRDQIRVREKEVKSQLGWQAIGNRAIDLLEKLVDKYCED